MIDSRLPTRKKTQHWYIRGWSYEEEPEQGKPKMSYHGEYYYMDVSPRQFTRRKILCAAGFLLILALYLALAFSGSSSLKRIYVGAACILSIITVIYQGMGAACFAGASQYMTCRSHHAGVLRLRAGSWLTGILMTEAAIGQCVRLCVDRQEPALFRELILLFCAVCIAGISLCMARAVKKDKFELLSNDAACKRMNKGGKT